MGGRRERETFSTGGTMYPHPSFGLTNVVSSPAIPSSAEISVIIGSDEIVEEVEKEDDDGDDDDDDGDDDDGDDDDGDDDDDKSRGLVDEYITCVCGVMKDPVTVFTFSSSSLLIFSSNISVFSVIFFSFFNFSLYFFISISTSFLSSAVNMGSCL
jgi:hypothetical protein